MFPTTHNQQKKGQLNKSPMKWLTFSLCYRAQSIMYLYNILQRPGDQVKMKKKKRQRQTDEMKSCFEKRVQYWDYKKKKEKENPVFFK